MLSNRFSKPGALGILGGDRRMLFLAEYLRGRGFSPLTACLPGEESVPADELLSRCEILLLPLPVSRDGVTLNAPLWDGKFHLDEGFAARCEGKTLLCGMPEKLACPAVRALSWLDYNRQESFLLGNARLTAEAAVALAITQDEGSLSGARCLVTGFGRIGKELCRLLPALGAKVDCAARKPEDRASIAQKTGCLPVEFSRLEDSGCYDIVFNTVPAPVLGEGFLARQRAGCLLLELASAPGGFSFEKAAALGLKPVAAPGLPGRTSPRAAGELLGETLCSL